MLGRRVTSSCMSVASLFVKETKQTKRVNKTKQNYNSKTALQSVCASIHESVDYRWHFGRRGGGGGHMEGERVGGGTERERGG